MSVQISIKLESKTFFLIKKITISQYQKYHNTFCLSLRNFAKALFLFSLGTYNDPKRNWKQCLCKIFEGQKKSIMIFLILANCGGKERLQKRVEQLNRI